MLLFNFANYVFLSLSLCILIVMYVPFCTFCFHRANWHSSATMTNVFPCFFLSCKANATVQLAKTGHGAHSSKMFGLFYILLVLCCSVYCLCVNVHCTAATGFSAVLCTVGV